MCAAVEDIVVLGSLTLSVSGVPSQHLSSAMSRVQAPIACTSHYKGIWTALSALQTSLCGSEFMRWALSLRRLPSLVQNRSRLSNPKLLGMPHL